MRFSTAVVLAFIAAASTVEAVPIRLKDAITMTMTGVGSRHHQLHKGRDYDDLYARDDIDIVAREPRVRIGNKLEHLNNGIGAVNGAVELYKNVRGRDYDDLYARDDLDLVAREPRGGRKIEHLTNGFGALTGAAQLYQNLKGRDYDDLYARDDLELLAREPAPPRFSIGNKLEHLNNGFGAVNGAIGLYKNLKGREYDDLYARDDLELVAREPRVRIGNKLEHLNNGFGAVNGAVELYKNLKGRDDELYAREPRVRIGNKLEHLNNGFGAVNGAVSLYKNLKGRDEIEL